MCWASGNGIFAIMADAAFRESERDRALGRYARIADPPLPSDLAPSTFENPDCYQPSRYRCAAATLETYFRELDAGNLAAIYVVTCWIVQVLLLDRCAFRPPRVPDRFPWQSSGILRERHQRRHISPQVEAAVVPPCVSDPLLRPANVLDNQRNVVSCRFACLALNPEALIEELDKKFRCRLRVVDLPFGPRQQFSNSHSTLFFRCFLQEYFHHGGSGKPTSCGVSAFARFHHIAL